MKQTRRRVDCPRCLIYYSKQCPLCSGTTVLLMWQNTTLCPDCIEHIHRGYCDTCENTKVVAK